jgi:hypothetical protein
MSDDAKTTDDMMPRTLMQVLDCIVAERGGRGAFNTAQLLAARGLVRVLNEVNNGDVGKAASIDTLMSMLPPKGAALAPIDMSHLSDRELAALERLVEIGNGTKPRIEHKPKSTRHWLAVELAAKLDAVVKGNIGEVDVPLKDLAEVRSLVMSLLSPLLTQDLFRDTFESAFAPYPVVPLPAVADNAPVAVPESPRAIPAAVDNVVPFTRGNGSAVVQGDLSERYPNLAYDPPVGRW